METKLSPPEPKDERLYNILIIAMIIGIVIVSGLTYHFRTTLYNRKDYFSEVFFPKPDDLPNMVKIGENYTYDFTIKSEENETKNLTYVTGIELYNLYEETEAKYRCLSQYRNKIFMDWTNETENISLIAEPRYYKEIERLAVLPNYEKKINWSEYTMEFGFPPSTGEGQLLIYFRNETEIKYKILIDETNNQTKFNEILSNNKTDLKKGNNKIAITVREGTISITINNVEVINEKYDNLYDGAFGFETSDAYFSLREFKVYMSSPIAIPDNELIYEYMIPDNYFHNKLAQIKSLRSKSIFFYRAYEDYNETIDCETESFYCNYFDLANDIIFILNETNLTKVVEKVPVDEDNINYYLYPADTNASYVDWESFDISLSHSQLQPGSKGSLILKFGDKWAIMITRNNSYFIRPFEGRTYIDEIRNPQKIPTSLDAVYVNVSKESITLFINNETVFMRKAPEDYTGGTMQAYVKNIFLYVTSLELKNHNPVCKDPYVFEFCELTLATTRQIAPTTTTLQAEDFQVGYVQNYEAGSQEDIIQGLDIENLISIYGKENVTRLIKEYGPENINISMINETIANITSRPPPVKNNITFPINNPYIPDRFVLFNTPSTIVNYSMNFSMDYSYTALDGARIMSLGLEDFYGNELLSMYALERENMIIIYHYDFEKATAIPIYQYINMSRGHSLSLEINEGNAIFRLDNDKVYTLNKTGITSGQFFIGSKNTYLETGNIHLNIKDRPYYRTLNLREDPCDLRLIYREAHEENITLEPEHTMNVTNSFNIEDEFDYGKVFVELYGSGNMTQGTPLEIHFWIMRED